MRWRAPKRRKRWGKGRRANLLHDLNILSVKKIKNKKRMNSQSNHPIPKISSSNKDNKLVCRVKKRSLLTLYKVAMIRKKGKIVTHLNRNKMREFMGKIQRVWLLT